MRFWLNKWSILCLVWFFIFGCAQTMQYTPNIATTSYQLPRLPANLVRVKVNDLRPETSPSDGLKEVLRGQITAALSQEPTNVEGKDYTIIIDIIENRSFFTLGNWNASTRLRVKLVDKSGAIIGQWDAVGNAQRSNMWGYATAKAVGQDSYNIAVADMMSSLSKVSVRE